MYREFKYWIAFSASQIPQIQLYRSKGVGLGRELSFLEIFDVARFWPCDPLIRGYDPLIRGSHVKGSHIRPLVKGVAS